MLELMHATTASLVGGWSETQVVLLVLGMMLVGVAMLSYFVIAPECEKRFEKQYAAIVQEATDNYTKTHPRTPTMRAAASKRLLMAPKADEKRKPRDAKDMEAAFSDDEASSTDSEPVDVARRVKMHMHVPKDLSRRRKSESDALRQETVNKAEMLRRRVLLRKLEEEIDGAIQETNAKAGGCTPHKQRSMRLIRRESLGFSDDRLKEIQEHSVECVSELEVLGKSTDAEQIKAALNIVHDVLTFYLSVDHRDMNKVTVFCNSLLKHDGLNHLRSLEGSQDEEIRSLANQIIEKAVPAIWH